MKEADAGEVLLLRAFETAGDARWSAADADTTSELALRRVGGDAPAEVFLHARAQHALLRLQAQWPALARWRRLPRWRAPALVLVVALAFAAGMVVDRLGSGQRIDLLAPPVWAVIAWNLLAYALLFGRRLFAPGSMSAAARALGRFESRRRGRADAVFARFAADWAALTLPLQSARLALALHLAAAALALGLVAGMYLRALVLDYAAGWQSTFLDAATVQHLLTLLLAPASAVSGITVPDVAGIAALRITPGAPAPASASAAPWIHLYAVQVALLVLLPRLALATAAAWRVLRGARQIALPLHEPYFQRLLRSQRGVSAVPLRLLPHGRSPEGSALLRLHQAVGQAFGAPLEVAPAVAYGDEDLAALPPEGTTVLLLFDLTATPEHEAQGRLLERLVKPGTLVLVDEGAFIRRFGADPPRRTERRAAWQALADAAHCEALFVDLLGGDAEALARTIGAARATRP